MSKTKGNRYFIYAPPLKGLRKSKRKKLPIEPYRGAPPWHRSVYYYWWEYLRRHEGYRRTCQNGGKGRYAKLYADFGDVHATDFMSWWDTHALLFAEPLPREVVCVEHTVPKEDDSTLLVAIPLENRLPLTMAQLRKLLAARVLKPLRRKVESKAPYPVWTKPLLPSLHTHLQVYDARKQNPHLADWEIADALKLPYNKDTRDLFETERNGQTMAASPAYIQKVLRRRAAQSVQRHLRVAEQYIENVAKGEFPKRYKR